MTTREKAICRELGVTPAGLDLAFRIKRGDCVSGGTAGEAMERRGYVSRCWASGGNNYGRTLTDAGKELCWRARELGW